MNIEKKLCYDCHLPKPITDFRKNRTKKDGHADSCISCMKQYMHNYYQRNKNRMRLLATENRRKYKKTLDGWASYAIKDIRTRPQGFSINKQDIINLYHKQKGLCAMSGERMDYTAGPGHPSKPSVDRIDNSRGYHLDNIRLVLYFVNQARHTFTDDQLYYYSKLLADFRSKVYKQEHVMLATLTASKEQVEG